jgi:hypothetical protein
MAPGFGRLERRERVMIDSFALAVSHGLIMLAFWRLLWRPDLDDDAAPPSSQKPFGRCDPPEAPGA